MTVDQTAAEAVATAIHHGWCQSCGIPAPEDLAQARRVLDALGVDPDCPVSLLRWHAGNDLALVVEEAAADAPSHLAPGMHHAARLIRERA